MSSSDVLLCTETMFVLSWSIAWESMTKVLRNLTQDQNKKENLWLQKVSQMQQVFVHPFFKILLFLSHITDEAIVSL